MYFLFAKFSRYSYFSKLVKKSIMNPGRHQDVSQGAGPNGGRTDMSAQAYRPLSTGLHGSPRVMSLAWPDRQGILASDPHVSYISKLVRARWTSRY